jgi:hypothetical protein
MGFQYKCLKDIYFPSEFYRPGEDIYSLKFNVVRF